MIAFIADLHLHPHKNFDTFHPKYYSQRFHYGLRVLEDISKDTRVKTLIIAGDLFHSRKAIPSYVLHFAYQTLKDLSRKGIEIFILAGNHDQFSYEVTNLSFLSDIPNLTIIDSAPVTKILFQDKDPFLFTFLPYRETPEEYQDLLDHAAGIRSKVLERYKGSFLITHISLEEGRPSSFEHRPKNAIPLKIFENQGYDHIFSGHYHYRQTVEKKFTYIGSPLQLTRAESQSKGYLLFQPTQTTPYEFFALNLPQFLTTTPEQLLQNAEYYCNHFVTVKIPPHFPPASLQKLQAQTEHFIHAPQMVMEGIEEREAIEDMGDELKIDLRGVSDPFEAIQTYARGQGREDLVSRGVQLYQQAPKVEG